MSQPPNLPRLSLLHATRGRPSQARECRQNWLNAAAKPERVVHIFAVDADDADSIRGLADLNPRIVERAGGGCVAAWNLAASASTGDVLIQLSDDWSPVQNWDGEFVKRLRDVSQPGVLRVSDGQRTDDLLCMAICTKFPPNVHFSPRCGIVNGAQRSQNSFHGRHSEIFCAAKITASSVSCGCIGRLSTSRHARSLSASPPAPVAMRPRYAGCVWTGCG